MVKIKPFICFTLFILVSCSDKNMDPDCVCYSLYAPVCTFDNIEFDNDCLAECEGYSSNEYVSGTCEMNLDFY
jgi:hypothetical protein